MVSLSKHRNKILVIIAAFFILLAVLRFINIPWMNLDIMIRAYQGDSVAQYKMGAIYRGPSYYCLYSCARGDTATALKWYLKAAEKEHPEALYEIGKIYSSYLDGRQLNEKDTEEVWLKASHDAKPWFEKAAARNHKSAKSHLAMYYHEIGDAVRAYAWMGLSRTKSTEKSRRDFFEGVNKQKKLKIIITEAQIREAELFIKEWKPLPAPPQIDISDLNISGLGCFGTPCNCPLYPLLKWLP